MKAETGLYRNRDQIKDVTQVRIVIKKYCALTDYFATLCKKLSLKQKSSSTLIVFLVSILQQFQDRKVNLSLINNIWESIENDKSDNKDEKKVLSRLLYLQIEFCDKIFDAYSCGIEQSAEDFLKAIQSVLQDLSSIAESIINSTETNFYNNRSVIFSLFINDTCNNVLAEQQILNNIQIDKKQFYCILLTLFQRIGELTETDFLIDNYQDLIVRLSDKIASTEFQEEEEVLQIEIKRINSEEEISQKYLEYSPLLLLSGGCFILLARILFRAFSSFLGIIVDIFLFLFNVLTFFLFEKEHSTSNEEPWFWSHIGWTFIICVAIYIVLSYYYFNKRKKCEERRNDLEMQLKAISQRKRELAMDLKKIGLSLMREKSSL